jgi:FeS assembly SUF system protein
MDENQQKPSLETTSDGHQKLTDQAMQDLMSKIIEALQTIYDPEIPVNIYDMGLIYGVDIDAAGNVVIQMTLTSPGCPVAAYMPSDVERKVFDIPGVVSCRVELVWDPPWNPDRMSEAAKLQLGFF